VTTLLVGNLSPKTTASDLKTVFSAFGEISSMRVACDHAGRTRGFALVELEDRAAAIALQSLKGAELKGRTMSVAVNRPLPVVRRQTVRSGLSHRKPALPARSHKAKA
jgi:RNA recognition motif-containing protein